MLQVSAFLWPVAKNNTTLSQHFSFGVAIHHILHWLPPVLLQARSAANRAHIFSWSASLLRGIPELCDTSNYAGERNVATKDGRRLMWFHQSSSWSLQTCDGSDLNATCCQAVIAHATSAVVTLIKSCTTRKLFHLVSSSCRVYR